MWKLEFFYIVLVIYQCTCNNIRPNSMRTEEFNLTYIIRSPESEPVIFQESVVIITDVEDTTLKKNYTENRERFSENDEIRFPNEPTDPSITLQHDQPVIDRFPIPIADDIETANSFLIDNIRNTLEKISEGTQSFIPGNPSNQKHFQDVVEHNDSQNSQRQKVNSKKKNKNKLPDQHLFKTTTQRLCEKKYDEYIRQIYRKENTTHGFNETDFDGRLLAEPGEYPHMAALGYQTEEGAHDYKCGGSLISDYFVITAAHCANFSGQAPSKVRIGDLNLMIEERELRPQTLDVERIYLHPDYNDSVYYNDLALIQLSTSVILSETARPIRLWTREDATFPNVYAMGYGSTAFAKPMTRRLTYFNLTLVPNEECNQTLPFQPATPQGIVSSQICAFDNEMKRDTCQGDSGGPLQYTLEEKRHKERKHYLLLGIISYGLYCRSNYPSVYTRVSSYLDWIENIVWEDNY